LILNKGSQIGHILNIKIIYWSKCVKVKKSLVLPSLFLAGIFASSFVKNRTVIIKVVEFHLWKLWSGANPTGNTFTAIITKGRFDPLGWEGRVVMWKDIKGQSYNKRNLLFHSYSKGSFWQIQIFLLNINFIYLLLSCF